MSGSEWSAYLQLQSWVSRSYMATSEVSRAQLHALMMSITCTNIGTKCLSPELPTLYSTTSLYVQHLRPIQLFSRKHTRRGRLGEAPDLPVLLRTLDDSLLQHQILDYSLLNSIIDKRLVALGDRLLRLPFILGFLPLLTCLFRSLARSIWDPG